MIGVSNSSPLVILAKLGHFQLLSSLFEKITISEEVYREVVVAGAGLAGAVEVAGAEWIEVRALSNKTTLEAARGEHKLGGGELSTIYLAKELGAEIVLLDDRRARELAKAEGLRVRGCVGLLETFHLNGDLADLREAFRQLRSQSYVEGKLLDARLRALGIASL